MDDDILRQRRNLIAISTLLILFDFADVKIAKVSILGTELIAGNPTVLAIFTWVIWAYFLLRYYQYWRQDQRSLLLTTMHDAINAYASFLCNSKAFKEKHKQQGQIHLKQESAWKLRLTKSEYMPAKGESVEVFSLNIELWRVIYWKIKAFLYFIIHTPHFTDHILPFALAIAAPIVTLFTKFNIELVQLLPN